MSTHNAHVMLLTCGLLGLVSAGCRPVVPAPVSVGEPEVVVSRKVPEDARSTFRRGLMEKDLTAAERAALTRVEALVAAGTDLNAFVGDSGMTPLGAAANDGYARAALLLVDNHADVSKSDERGYTPLHMAAVGGHVGVIEVLLSAGAEANAKHPENRTTALHHAAGHGKAAAVAKLLAGKADVVARDVNGMTPLHYACHQNHAEAVEALLAHGAGVDTADDKGNTPLHVAAAGYVKVIDQPKTVQTDRGTKTTYNQVNLECERVVELLINKKADLNRMNDAGLTPLAVAAKGADFLSGPNVRTIELLKKHGAK